MGLTCPSCKVEMKQETVNDIELDVCDRSCKGVWFDQGELEQIIEVKNKILSDNINQHFNSSGGDETDKVCPRCNINLYYKHWNYDSDLHFLFCNSCRGLFININEFSKIKAVKKQLEQEGKLVSKFGFFEQLYDPDGIFIEINISSFIDVISTIIEEKI
ncbi:MAG: zf-TFIIB domain-containing protein [Cyanobacteriota bacterium]